MREMTFYGTGLPGVEREPYTGKLIVVEGTDGVGRSTHIALLREWLEARGHAVLDTGMTRSVLAGRGIKEAKAGTTLGRLTMQLFYATDFADRLENQMLPALRAGFVVLTDRYVYSAIARAAVRGVDPQWVRAIHGIALVPDLILYLRIKKAPELVKRLLAAGRSFDFWESGMDLNLGPDFHDSFIAYQTLLLKEFDRMSDEYGFHVVNASRSIRRVQEDLRRAVEAVIEGRATPPKCPGVVLTPERAGGRRAAPKARAAPAEEEAVTR
ncbi:MAG TPA: thymidylate kinase [Pyrinomonadaceae bacterium]|nr:thymidylate kinase [Pyrinomonadaceae bacterium]